MKSKYDFKLTEENRYNKWLKKKYFQKTNQKSKKFFTVILPPPNITGKLHLGHAWNNVLQDIIVRRKRMLNFNVLFLPGMDHAGIATQKKIKEKLKQKGLKEQEINKNIFLNYASKWKEKYAKNIREQWSYLGLSLNYEYERFTLDPDISKIVEESFIELYRKKMIYRDYKIINWDPLMQTTLSNIEVEYKKVKGKLFYLKYVLIDSNDNKTNNFVEVATTRPETIFSDQALMVNPKDDRYKFLIGKKVLVPYTNKKIVILSDEFVDMKFGTGILKITPAHDENDFKLGKKYSLDIISCINKNGKMNELVSLEFKNLEILECRKKIEKTLKEQNLLSKIEDYTHSLGFSIISGAIVEPTLSLQWFLKTKELSLLILKKHKINFFPKRFQKIFENWLINLEDWCISRQLWWGHPIPVWYKNKEIKVQSKNPGLGFKRDPDVLDTWFSSSLWPLSTLGWSLNNKNEQNSLFLKHFPIDVLVTGYDILTFWVTRMILQSVFFTNKIPFYNILLHGLVKDEKGQKMSKSKGNGIDPLEIINQYGTDSLRWFLITNSSLGADLFFNENKIISSWKFINKLWNISYLIKQNIKTSDINFKEELLLLHEKSLLSQLSQLIKKIDLFFEKYEFSLIGDLLFKFIKEDLSNWYLEFFKNMIKCSKLSLNTQKFFLYILKNILKILNPFIPFVTDKIYEDIFNNQSIINSSWPSISFFDKQSLKNFKILKKIIIKMRHFRKFYNIGENKLFKMQIKTSLNESKELENLKEVLKIFFKVSEININNKFNKKENIFLFVEQNIFVFLNKETFTEINNSKRKKDILQQIEFLSKEIKRSENILNNKLFLQKAKKNKIQEEKEKYKEYLNKYKELKKNNIY
jgi:valyl-tRNA synthetase